MDDEEKKEINVKQKKKKRELLGLLIDRKISVLSRKLRMKKKWEMRELK